MDRWLSTKENGHKKTGATGYNRARHTGEVLFEVGQGRQGLVSAGDPCNAPGAKLLPERTVHALLPKLYISVT